MQRNRLGDFAILITVAIAIALWVEWPWMQQATAQTRTSRQSAGATREATPVDELQRSNRIDSYHLVARDGAARGETLYYYKCWACHNKYTIQAQHGDKAPFLNLKDLYQRPRLASGQPVNDETVTNQIQNGSAGMPSFRSNMSDADIADLNSYLKSGRCCVDGENPPVNPWYRAEAQKWPVQAAVSGGARGMVRIPSGESPEGIMCN